MSPIRRRRMISAVACVAACALVLVAAATVQACPTCQDALAANDPAATGAVRGYFWSILFMMSMPFLILAGLGSYFYYEVCKARARLVAGSGGSRLASRDPYGLHTAPSEELVGAVASSAPTDLTTV